MKTYEQLIEDFRYLWGIPDRALYQLELERLQRLSGYRVSTFRKAFQAWCESALRQESTANHREKGGAV